MAARKAALRKNQYLIIGSVLILIALVALFALRQESTGKNDTGGNDNIFPIGSVGKEVSFSADDGVKISAKYWDRKTEKKLILVHMLGGDKSDWNEFAENAPYTAIAIDLRGHGNSDGDLQSFSDPDFNSMVLDVKAASEYMGGDQIIVIGASIGSNIALNYADDYNVSGLVLLSPSHDYRGVDTRAVITRYKEPLLIVTSRDDIQSYNPSIDMYNAAPSEEKQLKTYDDAGHGTDMLKKPDLDDLILQFIKDL